MALFRVPYGPEKPRTIFRNHLCATWFEWQFFAIAFSLSRVWLRAMKSHWPELTERDGMLALPDEHGKMIAQHSTVPWKRVSDFIVS